MNLSKLLYDAAIVGDGDEVLVEEFVKSVPSDGGSYTVAHLKENQHGIRVSWESEDGRSGADTVSRTGVGYYLAYLKMLKLYPLEVRV